MLAWFVWVHVTACLWRLFLFTVLLYKTVKCVSTFMRNNILLYLYFNYFYLFIYLYLVSSVKHPGLCGQFEL